MNDTGVPISNLTLLAATDVDFFGTAPVLPVDYDPGSGLITKKMSYGGSSMPGVIVVTQTSHGFKIGEAVYKNSSGANYTRAIATFSSNELTTAHSVGIVIKVSGDGNKFALCFSGVATIKDAGGPYTADLTIGQPYYLSSATAGLGAINMPAVGAIVKPLFVPISISQAIIFQNNVSVRNQVIYAAATGSANTYAVTVPTTTGFSYTVGLSILVNFSATNTGASTLAVNGGAAKAIKKLVTTALAANDILSGQVLLLVYDGTNFQIASVIPGPITHGSTFFGSAGSGNFTVPAGITSVFVQLVGGGGGGGGNASAGGGGAGGFCEATIAVTPGASIPYVVGAGGAQDTNGTNTTFNTTVIANTGVSGIAGNGAGGSYSGGDWGAAGAAGGTTPGSLGDKPSGGKAWFFQSIGGIWGTTPAYGGGGFGDIDSGGGYVAQAGSSGLLYIRW